MWIQEDHNIITIEEMRIRIREKFGLNVSKSIAHVTARVKKNLVRVLVSIMDKSYFSLMNCGLAHI
ncbi:hypothetical protein GO684_02105 [Wolbachia endosymbiont of Litomosoides brasiliensis]|uniref:hypothetical protein n=1 Tax=Wolbachia endosymbiont of Litomosoides brasiliensis TaxID=1812117 RepID=UPI00158A0064|nr:hypothetical protein [Wolbachia endosymbiont of Litomosoides brasiliensis]NUY39483.1 hypothetical protein [Wolbachia endosymbiont of Litomosoides brasiliensis]